MNAYTDIITELTLEIVRLREVIDNLIKQKDSLYEKLLLAEKEIERRKVIHIEGPIFKPVFPPSIPFPESKEPTK